MVSTDDVAPVLTAEKPCSQSEEAIAKLKEAVSTDEQEENSDCVVMEVENIKNGHAPDEGTNGVHAVKNGNTDHEAESLKNDLEGDGVECIELDDDEDEEIDEVKEPDAKRAKLEESVSTAKADDKKSVLNTPEALLDKLDEYIVDAINSNKNVDRKILDALLGAINVQVQKEPLSVRKLILDKKLVLPNTISFPPSSIVDMLIEHDPEYPLSKVITKMFGEERPKTSETEKKEKQQLKTHNAAPHMTKLLLDIGQDLVQEATYCDIVHAKNLPEMPKNIETYKTVAAQLKPVWEALKKKNEIYKLPMLKCQVCGFQTESRLIMQNHRSKSHFKGGKYQCAMCPEYDTNEQRLINHYLESHLVIASKDEQQAKYPCLICDEDFQFKGLRDQHMKQCKKDFGKMRYIMAPKAQDDLLTVNKWLWDRPPIDPTILQQQQAAQKKNATQNVAQAGMKRGLSNNISQALLQQQLLRTQQQQQQQLQRQIGNFMNKNMQQAGNNALIAAMQQHLQRQAISGKTNQVAVGLAAAMAAATKGRLPNMGQLNQQAIMAAQQQLAQQAIKRTTQLAPATAKQLMSMMTGGAATSNGTTSSTSASTQLICEICDTHILDKEKYLNHLQANHKQMRGKVIADMNQGAPLACSRCRDRFWTYEGLERHLVMSHGLVTADLLQKAQKKEDGGRCKLCTKQYAFNMLQHLVADHQIKLCSAEIMYSCDVCSFKCSSYHLLENHLSTVHPKNGDKEAKIDAKKSGDECITLDD